MIRQLKKFFHRHFHDHYPDALELSEALWNAAEDNEALRNELEETVREMNVEAAQLQTEKFDLESEVQDLQVENEALRSENAALKELLRDQLG